MALLREAVDEVDWVGESSDFERVFADVPVFFVSEMELERDRVCSDVGERPVSVFD